MIGLLNNCAYHQLSFLAAGLSGESLLRFGFINLCRLVIDHGTHQATVDSELMVAAHL